MHCCQFSFSFLFAGVPEALEWGSLSTGVCLFSEWVGRDFMGCLKVLLSGFPCCSGA